MGSTERERICAFRDCLMNEEKSEATQHKYLREAEVFLEWLNGRELEKSVVLEYKAYLVGHYAPSSVNAALCSLNRFFRFLERYDLQVRCLKVQKQIFSSSERELSKAEYERLLQTAKAQGNQRLYWLMQTICSTGIRVSELCHITVESIVRGVANIRCKGKSRSVFLPDRLCKMLRRYARSRGIVSGALFVTKGGKPMDRSNIWAEMKKLCKQAGISDKKVFPHNLRHLFARTFYTLRKDIVRLADILGHSSVNTTRIYTMESGAEHRRQIQSLGLLRC